MKNTPGYKLFENYPCYIIIYLEIYFERQKEINFFGTRLDLICRKCLIRRFILSRENLFRQLFYQK
ncbi:MAG: hypothetical protein A2096_04925 [Spirochaetes bacterium GWF1_41_5]|nr:MAG: hypothetical protein A2096_04925 [Spirochaetes bacterium GWF1_41_5]HBE02284.1 hypothetical protein [Spirochaetia bacterium]